LIEGLVFIATETYARGQEQMGRMYLSMALEKDSNHDAAVRLKELMYGVDGSVTDSRSTADIENVTVQMKIQEIRNQVDIFKSKTKHKNQESTLDVDNSSNESDDISNQTPEAIYNVAIRYFNDKNLPHAEELLQLSCDKSNGTLSQACTNAVYLRTILCDWGEEGKGFEKDMDLIVQITQAETEKYRFVSDVNEMNLRSNGISDQMIDEDGVIQWKRMTSVHAHMMLGYPLDKNYAILKRYAAESMARFDEIEARLNPNGTINDLPDDLPYSVKEMRKGFKERIQQQLDLQHASSSMELREPIKVGFVGSGFNTKAVLFLSQDMFRFFDPSVVEIHIFSIGSPDHPVFIHDTMRGVDWRQNVIENVDYFHDVRHLMGNHIGLARFIHDKNIQILIEWDGYARQGKRASGLMALRPCPVQILHQEFLMTSGAQYVDYIITDKVVSPLSSEHLYTEKFLYLPNHFFSKGHAVQKEVIPPSYDYVPKEKGSKFQIGVGSPQENACLSSDENISFVYCNFNKFLKHNPETMRSWIRILQEVPNSVLCLLENPKEGIPNIRKFVTEATAKYDTMPDLNTRIHFLPWEQNPFDHQQRSFSLCNAMLDSYPYNGHTVAQDALYAGVPIVTRSDGVDMSSRVSTSANKVLGLDDLNANGVDDYENIAIRLGNDSDWFHSIRTKLIDSCLQRNPMHPYWDVPRYVKNFEKALTMAWDAFLGGEDTKHITVVETEDEIGTSDTELKSLELKRKEKKQKRAMKKVNMGSEL
jgi:protein O-GlcNAc transferase